MWIASEYVLSFDFDLRDGRCDEELVELDEVHPCHLDRLSSQSPATSHFPCRQQQKPWGESVSKD